MSSSRFFGAILVVSALLATPASAWEAINEPGTAAAMDPNFSIYADDGPRFSRMMASQTPLGAASGRHMSVRAHRGHTAGVKR